MRNLKITIAFAGTNYHGFQVQKNAPSVCEAFQDASEQILGERYDIKGCSRTDAGVHAREYVLSMKCETDVRPDKLVLALNRYLPEDIAALSVEDVPEDFHARYSATGKEYVYRLRNSRIKDPFSPRFAYRFGYPLDVDMLNREAGDFVGTHDFAAFQSAGSDMEDTVRTVERFTVRREGEDVLFAVKGNGFLYNMVRIMVGTLLFIGVGRLSEGCIPEIIKSKDRARAGKTMPALGLFLNQVYY